MDLVNAMDRGRAPHGARGLKFASPLTGVLGYRSRAPHGARGLKLTSRGPRRSRPCRAPHGARGLKYTYHSLSKWHSSRAPHGARGLKFKYDYELRSLDESRPTRGAWIEITFPQSYPHTIKSRAPHGARGLKSCNPYGAYHQQTCRAPHGARGLKLSSSVHASNEGGRAPHGARGLKYAIPETGEDGLTSRPTRGAWIEIQSPR